MTRYGEGGEVNDSFIAFEKWAKEAELADRLSKLWAWQAWEAANRWTAGEIASLRADNAELQARITTIVHIWDASRLQGVTGAAGYFELTRAIDAARKEEQK
jgi:hypothetical protein